MKRILFLLIAAIMSWTMVQALSPAQDAEGYVITSKLKSHNKRSLKSRVKSTIAPGRVAIKTGDNIFSFHIIDAAEFIKTQSGAFYKYFPPAQDIVPAEYIAVADFKKSVRKVKISSQLPTSWELGKRYVFKPIEPNEYVKSATVRAVRLKGDYITLVTKVDDNFKPTKTINITGKTIIEVAYNDEKLYWYNGEQIMPAENLDGKYGTLHIDDNGVPYSVTEDGNRNVINRLSNVLGEIPMLDYFGWISSTQIVIDDLVLDLQ